MLNGNIITQEDLIAFYKSSNDSIRKSTTFTELNRQLTLDVDDRYSKTRTRNKSKKSRIPKSAPQIRRSKSQVLKKTKRK